MVNTEIRLIMFAAKDGEVLCSQQKQDWKLTVAQIMNSLLSNSDLKKVGTGHGHSPSSQEQNRASALEGKIHGEHEISLTSL